MKDKIISLIEIIIRKYNCELSGEDSILNNTSITKHMTKKDFNSSFFRILYSIWLNFFLHLNTSSNSYDWVHVIIIIDEMFLLFHSCHYLLSYMLMVIYLGSKYRDADKTQHLRNKHPTPMLAEAFLSPPRRSMKWDIIEVTLSQRCNF